MIITLDKTYYARVDSPLLGYIGETESRIITSQGYQTEGADRYILRFSYPDGAQYDVDITDGTYTVQASLLRAVGNVKCQVLAVRSTGAETYKYVKKSNVFVVTIKPSVGGDTPIPTYEETVAVLDKVLAAEIAADECIAARDTAVTAAETAVQASNAAQTARTAAEQAATVAEDNKTTAVNAAQTAAQAAQTANNAADVAVTAKNTATTAANTATAKATAAESSAIAAQTAQTAAETAATTANEKATEIADSAEQIATNTSDITELKGDLSDFKDLADFADSTADSKDTLYIVDVNGKIIATVSKDGIDTVGYKKHGEDFVPGSVDLLETYDDVFYIADRNGNVIFKASKDGIEGVNISASSPSPYKDKVMLSIGDSLSAHDNWQKWLVEWYGVSFDADANVNGKDGHAPMAKGGTAVIPNSVDSIYIRALDAHYYNPNLIILYAGQNDVPYFGSATELNPTAIGNISDIPYRKTVPYTQLPESEYADYTSWYEGRPTLYSYCMGLVENLIESCPTAQIIVLTPMQMWTSDGTQSVGRKQLVTTWHDICNKYALPIIDLWNESGVNAFNMSEYYPNVGNVHPNDYGYKRIAETIYSKM